MIERSGELPEDVDELKALTLANAARANQSEADAQAARGEVLKLKAEVNDLAEANATAKAEIARLNLNLRALLCGAPSRRLSRHPAMRRLCRILPARERSARQRPAARRMLGASRAAIFFELHANTESVVATATVEQMKLLWAVEDEVRG